MEFFQIYFTYTRKISQVENVSIEIHMPKTVMNCSLVPNQGRYSFDQVSKILVWDIGRIDVAKLPNLRGTVRNLHVDN